VKQQNYRKGKRGEEIAESYLRRQGFQIIEKNYHTRFGEIDIIATRDSKLHFVEVKLKIGEHFGTPEEMIDKRKLWQVTRTAESYLLTNRDIATKFPEIRVDAFCVVLDTEGNEQRADFYENLTGDM